MIIGYYAVGPQGEFGNAGKLPWGSFPKELQALRRILELHNHMTVLVGFKTWKSLPSSFKELLTKVLKLNVAVYAHRSMEALEFKENNPDITVWFSIDFSMKDYYSESSVAVLGGATLLKECLHAGILDGAVISNVWEAKPGYGVCGFSADVILAEELYLPEAMPPSSSMLIASHTPEEGLSFVQEYHFFGTV